MIRRRLTATIVALVAVIGGVVAVVFLTTLESRLTDAVDRELERAGHCDRGDRGPPGTAGPRETRIYDIRRIAYVRVGPVAIVPRSPADRRAIPIRSRTSPGCRRRPGP